VTTPERKSKAVKVVALVGVGLVLSVIVLTVTMIILRRGSMRGGRGETRAQRAARAKAAKRGKADAWTEAGRRLDPNAVSDTDTVDFDPRELSRDDIEPPDEDDDGPNSQGRDN